MAISYIGSASGTNTATMPTHAVGDLLVVFAFRDGNTTAPTLVSGWTNIQASGASTCSARMAWRIATSTSMVTGTWTNATSTIVAVYRGADSVGGSAITGASSTTISYPAVTLQVADGTSWVVGAAGHRSANVAIQTAPSGMTNRISVSDATDEAALHDTNAGVTSFTARTAAVGGTASGYRSISVELKAIVAPVLSEPVVDLITSTSGTPKVTTNRADGTLYMVAVANGDTPSTAQIKLGQNSTGAAAINAQNLTVTTSGIKTFTTVTGLTTDTPYDFWFVHTNSAGDSTAVKADFTPVLYPDYTPTWKAPGTASGWTNSGNVAVADGAYSTTTTTGWLTTGAVLSLSNFSLALPSGLAIKELRIRVKGYYTTTNSVVVNYDPAPPTWWTDVGNPVGGTAVSQSSAAYIDVTEAVREVLWAGTVDGRAFSDLTVAELNNSSFGLLWTAPHTSSNATTGGDVAVFVDSFEIMVVDNPPATPQAGSTLFWAFP